MEPFLMVLLVHVLCAGETDPFDVGKQQPVQARQHLDETEDIAVKLLTEQEVKNMLVNDQIKQALMAAPLWKYFATKCISTP